MSLISIEIREAAAILKLNREITNAINHQLVDELAGALREFGPDQAVRSLVLTSNNEKFFSIGLDIPQLYDLPLQEFKHFYHNFNQVCIDLLTFPKPTIAAIPGHAIAGGCILALCCDYRIIAAGRRLMGLNEVKLGVAVPYPAACVLPHIVGYRNAREMMYTGNFYTPEESYSIGLVDEVVPLEYVRSRSIEKATVLSAGSAQAIAQIKWGLVEPIRTQIERHIQEKEDYFIERWYADDTRISLKEAMEKF